MLQAFYSLIDMRNVGANTGFDAIEFYAKRAEFISQ
jgi:hypothetical protein